MLVASYQVLLYRFLAWTCGFLLRDVYFHSVFQGDIFLLRRSLPAFTLLLKFNSWLRFNYLIDLVGHDYPARRPRFVFNYLLLSTSFLYRLVLTVQTKEFSFLPTLTPYFLSANWLEREAWDMFGIPIVNHPDLRRILTDYGFFAHPLRKNYPTSGYFELFYDSAASRSVYDYIELAQESREVNLVVMSPKV